MQCPLDFVAIPLLIGAATVIGKQFRIAPKAHDNGWVERPCLWGAIVGDVGSAKTPAMNAALAPLWKLQAEQQQKDQQTLELWQKRQKQAKFYQKAWEAACKEALKKNIELPPCPAEADPGPQPYPRQFITNDTTQEKIAQLIEREKSGVLLFRDELSGAGSSHP